MKQVFADVTYHTLAGPDAATIRARDLPGSTLGNAGAGIKIGIIDDGVDQKHAFFDPSGYTMPEGFPKGQAAYTTAKVIVARAFAPSGATWKYAGVPFDPEDSGHATHVAGIAAGNANTNANGMRISGIAPRAYIGNYKALTFPTRSGLGLNGNAPEIVAAIEAAVADGMDVINLSLGEPEIEPSRDIVALALDAAAAAGVVPVVAAGNDFDDFGRGSVGSPGSALAAITVGATTSTASPSMASFSSAGPTPISLRLKPDVVAPGTSILSSQPGGWGLSSGTSMAAPHVSGAVALLLQRHPSWRPAEVKAALTATAKPLAGGDGQVGPTRAGAGLVDVAAADAPAIRPTPTAVSFGLVHSETITSKSVAVEDVGGGAGEWTVSVTLSGTPEGTEIDVPPTITVPGPLSLDLVSGTTDGEVSGAVILRRGTVTRRIPFWGRVEIPKLSVAKATHPPEAGPLQRQHARPSGARRHVSLSRGPGRRSRLLAPGRPRAGVPGASRPGRSRTSGWRSSRAGPGRASSRASSAAATRTGSRATPRSRSTRTRTSRTSAARCPSQALSAPRRGRTTSSSTAPTPPGPGRYRFRFWVDDVKPPAAAIVSRKVRRGDPIRVTVTDGGSGIDVSSIEATLDGREARAPLVGREIRVATGSLAPGRHRLRLALSDFQETRNNENVARILPNTRIVSATVTIVPAERAPSRARLRRARGTIVWRSQWTPLLEEARLRRPHRQARPRPSSCARRVPRRRSFRAHASGRSSTTFTDAA